MLHIVLKTVGIQWKKGKICGILNKKDKILGAAKAQPKEAALDEARLLLLRRTREGREWKKEQEEWERLMKCLDRWIDALRDAAGRKSGDRSGGVTAEGGEALLSI